ncbi:NADH dehydrogenase [Rhodococcus sp. WMMA185]|uniref:NAD(P)/FAD-dependent oxidoreductase n=1 Tax=Rhodococcus sp. WMMA185 TaxID=679318 RepID=UPI000877ED37|nr:NAD(P)/FAD-dependent oxidoreductase [Rhodococcus sp. WMMA185]AOW91806.1 NADH dehydrogenase [Rhodococcus sp. WMMA185]
MPSAQESSSVRVKRPWPRVVILGGGFAGIYAARRLRNADVDITLLDRGTSHVFQPLLYQCATGLLSEGEISSPLRHLLRGHRNVHVALGEARSIDPDAKVLTASRFDGSAFDLHYDYLIVAVGMRQAYHGHDEYIQWAPGMKTVDDALAIRRKLISAFEMAESLPTARERRPWLTFAVAGGGPTGVEMAGQIRELATHSLAHEFRSIDPSEARVLLFHGGDRVLESFDRKLSAAAQKTLDKVGVETHLGVHVTDVCETGIETTSADEAHTKKRYEARTVLWTAGVEAVPFAAHLADALGAKQTHGGRIEVEPDLTVPGHPDIWVVGDLMSLDELPGVAEVAMQSGKYVGGRIAKTVAGGKPDRKPFKYRDFGSAAYIARRHALLQAGPIRISGFAGWVSWGVIHIAFLAGYRNRFGTLLNWATTLATGSRRERAITYGDPESARQPYADPSSES